ncbi:xylose isomerase-like protein [Xylariales sp. PMI_506]|nr:xylose isomerase-like protein [Xylariales sp. PMI_506]
MANLSSKWAVATISLGKHPLHSLERKLNAAKRHGFAGIELVRADLDAHARTHNQTPTESAKQIRALCSSLDIEVLSLNPFKNFEGGLTTPLKERLELAKEWIDLATTLGAHYLQMPSYISGDSTGDETVIIPELQALADLAAESRVNIAYEAVAFAQHNALWQDSLRIVQAVDRPNFGLCLDSFHIHARLWGDACAPSGLLPDGPRDLEISMEEFLRTCPIDKVFYIQLSDASKFDPPLSKDSPLFAGLEVQDARLAWSRSARPFPLEEPGYFPVVEIAKTWLVDYGWPGWVSLEGFLLETEREENGPEVMAERAQKSIEKLYAQLSGNF